ncbi:MAG: hypothetical protein CBB99_06385 [Bacteroidetes bacterium TMED39]|nr:MAG: hypothetical protein CBB99_06385 [Bacteroidetes bacterium TMED39]
MKPKFFPKESILFVCLAGIFITNALLAEFIGVKIFSVEKSLGIPSNFLGIGSFDMTAGVLLWPFVFILTDIINEYFGKRGVFFLSCLTAILISYGFLAIGLSIKTTPASWWPSINQTKGIENMQTAYKVIFGQSNWIIVGSLVAFLVGQVLDILIFQSIKKRTGEKYVWFRATGSTLISQLIDSFIVLFLAFYVGAGWSFDLVLSIAWINYIYKLVLAILLTPLLYIAHGIIDNFLGKELSKKIKEEAILA